MHSIVTSTHPLVKIRCTWILQVEQKLGVQFRNLVDRVENESILLCCPDFTDVFVWLETVQGHQPRAKL